MASQARQAGTGSRRRKAGAGRVLITGILLLPVIAVLFPTCMVLASGMVPTVVAYLVDRSRAKFLTLTVGMMNFCGTLPGIVELWQHWQSYDVAGRIATDPFFWAFAYTAAGVGWLIFLSLPPILGSFYSVVTDRRVAGLRKRQSALVDAWGEEVARGNRKAPVGD
jgi:hypothetical protein